MPRGVILLLISLVVAFSFSLSNGTEQDKLNLIRVRLVKEAIEAKLQREPPDFTELNGESLVTPLAEGLSLVYSVDLCLQRQILEYFQKSRPRYGAFVAVEPATGKVLAMVDYARDEADPGRLSLRSTYPAASVFKLITAAAALEKGRLTPDTLLKFRGNPYLLTPQVLKESRKRDRASISFKEALGKSNNVVFGRVAEKVGSRVLLNYAEAFKFNRPIEFQLPLEVSRAAIPSDDYHLARAGAGFEGVTISPLHAALLAAAIANNGTMMAPQIVKGVVAENGEEVYVETPRAIGRPVAATTAAGLREMMRETVVNGTSTRVFQPYLTRAGKPFDVAGKTGTLFGDDPPGRYEWFVGFAPIDGARIAVAAMVINDGRASRVKGSHVALEGFKAFFLGGGCL